MGKHLINFKKPKWEFSKLMAVLAVGTWILNNLFGYTIIILFCDPSPFVYIQGSVNAVVAIVLGFYFWKSRTENIIKLRRIYGIDAEFAVKHSQPNTTQIIDDAKDDINSILNLKF
jgi:hypothetical protein